MPPPDASLPLRHAVALGLAQGPTELLPVSSSAHTALIGCLAGWRYGELDAEWRKSFQVVLHAGTALALGIAGRRELIASARRLDRRGAEILALSLAPAVIVGYALERPIERRLDSPASIAAGLIAGAAAMVLADTSPAGGTRRLDQASRRDGLALGIAQAFALIPGVSRNGATLAAARARGFGRADAQTLSWQAALPVILGASALKAIRLASSGAPPGSRSALAAGGLAALSSTTVSARLLRRLRHQGGALAPYAAYRCLLAAIVLGTARDRRAQTNPRRLRWAHNRSR